MSGTVGLATPNRQALQLQVLRQRQQLQRRRLGSNFTIMSEDQSKRGGPETIIKGSKYEFLNVHASL